MDLFSLGPVEAECPPETWEASAGNDDAHSELTPPSRNDQWNPKPTRIRTELRFSSNLSLEMTFSTPRRSTLYKRRERGETFPLAQIVLFLLTTLNKLRCCF